MKFLSLIALAAVASAAAMPQETPPPIPLCSYNIHNFFAEKQPQQPHAFIDFNLRYVCDARLHNPQGHCTFHRPDGHKIKNANGACDLPLKNFTFNLLQKTPEQYTLTIYTSSFSGSMDLPFTPYELDGKQYTRYTGNKTLYISEERDY